MHVMVVWFDFTLELFHLENVDQTDHAMPTAILLLTAQELAIRDDCTALR